MKDGLVKYEIDEWPLPRKDGKKWAVSKKIFRSKDIYIPSWESKTIGFFELRREAEKFLKQFRQALK